MRILVTGANGYLGQGIVKSIINMGHEVIATDFSTEYVDGAAKKMECNIFELQDPYTYFGEPDVLVHLAWRDGFIHYSDNHIADLPFHYFFIKKMIDSGLNRIAVMGSMHEIGFFEGSIKENSPCNPTTPYGISKNALRELTFMYANQKNVVVQWLRGFYIVGNSKYGNSIFSKITSAEIEGNKEFPFTLGMNQFDFIDYEEFCEQVAFVVNQNEINGIINICSGRPERLADRVERFIKDNNYNIRLNYGAFPDRPYDSKAVWGDNTKIKLIMKRE